MPLARAALANREIGDIPPQLDNLAGELMAGDQRHGHGFFGPGVPVPDMHIGATNAGFVYLDQHLIRANLWHRSLHHPQTFSGV